MVQPSACRSSRCTVVCHWVWARSPACCKPCTSQAAGMSCAGVPTKRSSGVSGVDQVLPSKLARRASHSAATPACCQRATSARKAASRAVKYCAPWSHCQGPCRLQRGGAHAARGAPGLCQTHAPGGPPEPGLAHDRPARPAPMMAIGQRVGAVVVMAAGPCGRGSPRSAPGCRCPALWHGR